MYPIVKINRSFFYWPRLCIFTGPRVNSTPVQQQMLVPVIPGFSRCFSAVYGIHRASSGGSKTIFLLGRHLLGICPSPNEGMQEMSDKSWRSVMCSYDRAGCVWICSTRFPCLSILARMFGLEPFHVAMRNSYSEGL